MIQAAQPSRDPGANRRRRTTLKDVAREAGLSIAAVSMALRNSPDLAADTVARVKKIAAALGYAPDPALAALAAYRSRVRPPRELGTIAFISNWSTRDGWTRHRDPSLILSAMKRRSQELGYKIEHFWVPECGNSPRRLDQILQTRGIKGLILAPEGEGRPHPDLQWDRYSVVCITRPSNPEPFQYVCVAHFHAVMTCWHHLMDRGYTRIGLAVETEINPHWRHQWNAAHEQARCEHGLQSCRIPPLAISRSESPARIRQWLREYRPDAVISRCPRFAEAAAAEGLSIPGDIGYVSLNIDDDLPEATGIRQPCEEIGIEAIENLHWQLIRNRRGRRTFAVGIEVSGTWVEGCTLPVRSRDGDRNARARTATVAA
ncbi:MAG: LacI family transcriptional regulator [Verrucomicrobia bacterium]|nr:MAG: LacI family transcriptional regulator [Verrucomicrobiota bacterium]